jgi:hypothetical protein
MTILEDRPRARDLGITTCTYQKQNERLAFMTASLTTTLIGTLY